MIEVSHLTKCFGSTKAVDDLSFAVQDGQAVTFWGANGAGKTVRFRGLRTTGRWLLFPYG